MTTQIAVGFAVMAVLGLVLLLLHKASGMHPVEICGAIFAVVLGIFSLVAFAYFIGLVAMAIWRNIQ